jgi:hypothetical protein
VQYRTGDGKLINAFNGHPSDFQPYAIESEDPSV